MTNYVVRLTDDKASDPALVGPKTANQAALARAGLPTPGGFVLTADAYHHQLAALGLEETAEKAVTLDYMAARNHVSKVRIAMFDEPLVPEILEPLLAAYRELVAAHGPLVAVRSSSLMEDTEGSSFAGQFQTFLGVETEADFLTTVRACWGALWSPRALKYMDGKDIRATDTAMAVLVQPLIQAIASGGGLSQTASGGMSISATWGLGETIAQGEVVPDRYDLSQAGELLEIVPGRKGHSIACAHHGATPGTAKVEPARVEKPCLDETRVAELAAMMKQAQDLMSHPVEVEWAMDDTGIKMLQARPLHVERSTAPDDLFAGRPGLRGHPGGIGWGAGRAVVINCECEIGRIAPGDILVTKVAGPALAHVLPQVSGVVAELGGSTSHLASLGRERGIPMVLGVMEATSRIPDGATVGVDGVAGVVRWMQE
jgi:pyruvate,water dikinase